MGALFGDGPGPLRCPVYSIDKLHELGKTLPILKCDVSKFTGDAWRAQLVRPPKAVDVDIVFPADFPRAMRRKLCEIPDRRLPPKDPVSGRYQLGRKKGPARDRHPATAALSIKIPPPFDSQHASGFEHFLETVPSPTHSRVTAGGRVVPAEPGSVSPVAANRKPLSSPVLRAVQQASPLYVHSAPPYTSPMYQAMGSVNGYNNPAYGGSYQQDAQPLSYVPILGPPQLWQKAFPQSLSRANCPLGQNATSALGNITNTPEPSPKYDSDLPLQFPQVLDNHQPAQDLNVAAESNERMRTPHQSPAYHPVVHEEFRQVVEDTSDDRARFLELQSEKARLRRVRESAVNGSAQYLDGPAHTTWNTNLASDPAAFMSSIPAIHPSYYMAANPGWVLSGQAGGSISHLPGGYQYRTFNGQPAVGNPSFAGSFNHASLPYGHASTPSQYFFGSQDGANDLSDGQGMTRSSAGTGYRMPAASYVFGLDGDASGYYDGEQTPDNPFFTLDPTPFSAPMQQGQHLQPPDSSRSEDVAFGGQLANIDMAELDVLGRQTPEAEQTPRNRRERADDKASTVEESDDKTVKHASPHKSSLDFELMPAIMQSPSSRKGRDEQKQKSPIRTRYAEAATTEDFAKPVPELIDVEATTYKSKRHGNADGPAFTETAEANLRKIQAKGEPKSRVEGDEDAGKEQLADHEPSNVFDPLTYKLSRKKGKRTQGESFLQTMLKNPRYSSSTRSKSANGSESPQKDGEKAEISDGPVSDDKPAPPKLSGSATAESDAPIIHPRHLYAEWNAWEQQQQQQQQQPRPLPLRTRAPSEPGSTSVSTSSETGPATTTSISDPTAPASSSTTTTASHHREVMLFFDRLRRHEDAEIAKYRVAHPL